MILIYAHSKFNLYMLAAVSGGRFSAMLIMVFFSWNMLAQKSVAVSGIISEKNTGETLIGAFVEIPETNIGVTSNAYGYYSITLPATSSEVTLRFSYIGYQTISVVVVPDKDIRMDISMESGSLELQEVVISEDNVRENIRSTQMSVENISALEAKVLPALFGEVDIIKTIQLKPGISSGSEGSTGLFVRGGSNDQNLIVLDEALVYNADHLFGFFSVFNSDAIKDVKVYKGGFPAQYGGRLSSVIDVRLREGNKKKFSGTGGIGLISSRLTLEGPIQKDKSSFIISGRRTYVDLITNLINEANADNPNFNRIPGYNFYDLNAKANFKLSEKDVLYVAGYFGRDVFGFNSSLFKFNFNWGNATGTLRWNHLFNSKMFSNTTLTVSDYQYNISNEVTGFSFGLGSNIKDVNLKYDLYYTPGSGHEIRAGLSVTQHRFDIGRLKAGSNDGEISFSAGQMLQGTEYGLYISDDWDINTRIKLNAGMRLTGFSGNDAVYVRPEPRVAIRYLHSPRLSVKASYARMHQYIHLVSNSGISLPTDVWYPSTKNVKPQQSDQVAAGWSYEIRKGLALNNEFYYKRLSNQIDFIDHARLFANDNLEQEFAFGDGYSYGMELGLEKTTGKFTGWIGYTLAYVRRGNFDRIMGGRFFAPRFDRRHDLSVVAIYDAAKWLSLTATFVYGSGDLTWLPSGRSIFQDVSGAPISPILPIYGDRNTFRMPAYHRMDLGIVFRFFPKWGENDLTISVYNVYDRRNPYFLFLEPQYAQDFGENGPPPGAIPVRIAPKQVSLFPILPSFTWNFKF
jgi:hypothetical protein